MRPTCAQESAAPCACRLPWRQIHQNSTQYYRRPAKGKLSGDAEAAAGASTLEHLFILKLIQKKMIASPLTVPHTPLNSISSRPEVVDVPPASRSCTAKGAMQDINNFLLRRRGLL